MMNDIGEKMDLFPKVGGRLRTDYRSSPLRLDYTRLHIITCPILEGVRGKFVMCKGNGEQKSNFVLTIHFNGSSRTKQDYGHFHD
jgi:hypothetical protein